MRIVHGGGRFKNLNGLTVRAANTLSAMDILSREDLDKHFEKQIKKIPGMGIKTYREVMEWYLAGRMQ